MDKYERALAKHNHKEERRKKYLRMCQITFAAGIVAGWLMCFMVMAQFLAK